MTKSVSPSIRTSAPTSNLVSGGTTIRPGTVVAPTIFETLMTAPTSRVVQTVAISSARPLERTRPSRKSIRRTRTDSS